MNDQIIIKNNFFKNPYLIRGKGFLCKYYDKNNHPDPSAINSFPGIRSIDLRFFDLKLHNYIKTQIQSAVNTVGINGIINPDENEFRLNYSLTFKNTPYNYHYDIEYNKNVTNYAGVIYLNKNAPKNYGTSIVLSDRKIDIENVFNRMVIYPTTMFHSLSGSFGNNIFNARMVVSIFFNLIQ